MLNFPKRYWMVWIAACCMIGATLSMKNIAGLFFAPVAETFGTGRGAVSLTLTTNNLMLAAGDYFSPRLFHSGSYRRLSRLCVLCAVGTTFLMGWAPNLAVLYVLCALRGFSSGLLGIVLGTVVINNWFVRGNSFVTGVAMAMSGLGSAVLSPILSGVIEAAGWRAGFRAEALVGLLLYAPLVALPVTFRPEDQGLTPFGGRRSEADAAAVAAESRRFGLLLPGVLVLAAFANAVSVFTNHMPGVANSYAMPAAVGAGMLSASMVTNAGGKVLIGALAERRGIRRPAMAYAALIAVGMVLLLTVHTVPVALVCGAILGLAFSLTTVVPALVTKDVFGQENYRRVFPVVMLAGTLANASFASLIGFIYDGAGSYRPAMLLLTAFLVGIIVLLCLLYRNRADAEAG